MRSEEGTLDWPDGMIAALLLPLHRAAGRTSCRQQLDWLVEVLPHILPSRATSAPRTRRATWWRRTPWSGIGGH